MTPPGVVWPGSHAVTRNRETPSSMKAIDLFAGAGGFTTGASRAGVDVAWAANHWRLAVDVHAARHPSTQHSCQDLQQADFSQVPDHDLLLASPVCKGNSTASQPSRSFGLNLNAAAQRATAFAVIDAAEAKRPEWLLVENVTQMREWMLYPHWRAMLETLGYELEELVLDAADFGTPQNRRRLFIVGRQGRAPGLAGRFPVPTRRARPGWCPMSAALSLDDPGGRWRPVASKSPAVRERVRRSRVKLGHPEAFLTQHVRDHTGRSLDQPFPTITTGDQMAVVRGDLMRPLTVAECLVGMGFERDYFDGVQMTRTQAIEMIGNAVAVPVAEELCARILSQ